MGMASNRADGPTSDINITPLIDVMLVLLVIFMVVIPLNQNGLDVELPPLAEQAQQEQTENPNQLVIDIDASFQITVNKQATTFDQLFFQIRDILETRTDKTLFLKADPSLNFGEVVSVLDIAKGAGAERVGIVPTL